MHTSRASLHVTQGRLASGASSIFPAAGGVIIRPAIRLLRICLAPGLLAPGKVAAKRFCKTLFPLLPWFA
jgi:hypothetical protein